MTTTRECPFCHDRLVELENVADDLAQAAKTSPRPFALNTLEACRHAIAVLELEKAKYKLSARILGLKLARAEVLLKQARKGPPQAQKPVQDTAGEKAAEEAGGEV